MIAGLILPPGVRPPHVERMAVELKELSERVDKLSAFLSGPAFDSLPEVERALLHTQQAAMLAYQGVLTIRLNLALGN